MHPANVISQGLRQSIQRLELHLRTLEEVIANQQAATLKAVKK